MLGLSRKERKQKERIGTLEEKDYKRIGKLIYPVLEEGFLDHKRIYKTAFIKGIMAGVGSVLGATVVITLVFWILTTVFRHTPVGEYVEKANQQIQQPR